MKTLTILFLSVLILPSYGRILTVSNMPNSPGQYTSMNDVIGAVISGAGDTIFVHGSPINYGTVILSRDNIVVIGTGHNPDKQFPYVTTFTEIFVTGNNIQLIGITANGIQFFRNNFAMRRCKILGTQSFPSSVDGVGSTSDQNLLFESNVFTSTSLNMQIQAYNPDDVVTIRNNVFSNTISINVFSLITSCLISNNLFLKGPNAFGNINYATISNNIFYGSSPFVPVAATIRYQNNISFQCLNNTFTTGPNIISTNNLEDVDPQFVNYPGGGAVFSELHDYNLAASSPGKATGSDGADRGVYGGFGTIFNMRGEPPISEITAVTITSPTTVPSGGTLNITVTSKRVH